MWAAQLDNPPSYPVNKICSAIDGAPSGTDILGRVAAGVNASVFGNSCHSASGSGLSRKSASAWEWQVLVNPSCSQSSVSCAILFSFTPQSSSASFRHVRRWYSQWDMVKMRQCSNQILSI